MSVYAAIDEQALSELQAMEEAVARAAEAYERAHAILILAIHKYAAVRDFVQDRSVASPYAPTAASWGYYEERGRFRFVNMKMGDAILQILGEAKQSLTLAEIGLTLRRGGFGYPEQMFDLRAVNAGLLKTGGVLRVEDSSGAVKFKREEIDVDDLPFE